MCEYQISNILNKIMLIFLDRIFHLFRVHKDDLSSSGPIFAQPLICSRFVKYLSLPSICICPPQHYYFSLHLWPGACLTDRQLSKACQPPFGDFQLCFYGLIAVIFIVCLLAFSRKYSEEWHSPHLSTCPHCQSQGGRLAISERRRTSQSQSRDPQSGKSQSRNRAQSTIGAQTTRSASWYLGVRRCPRIGHTGSEVGVDRSGGQYRSCGTEIHKMGVDRCTNMYKCTKMGVDRCGGEGQCGDQVGAPGAREKDTERDSCEEKS